MKYSLQSLMIVVTLGCVLLGGLMGRIKYLSRMADYHDRQSVTLLEKEHYGPEHVKSTFRLMEESPEYSKLNFPKDEYWARSFRVEQEAFFHRQLASEYRRAILRPWIIIDESSLTEFHRTP